MTVVDLVHGEQRRLRARLLAGGAATGVAAAAALLAAGVLVLADARWLALPRALPVLVWLLALAAGALVVLLVRRALRSEATPARVAAEIERERSLRAGELRSALEIGRHGPLGALAAQATAERMRAGAAGSALAPALQRRAARRALTFGGAAAAALAALAALGVAARDGAAALLHPADAWRGTLLAPLHFEGMPQSVVRGERLRVRVSAPGRRHVRVARRTTGQPWRVEEASVDARGIATIDVGFVDADLVVAATDGRATTDTAHVAVADRAFVGDVAIRAEYPAYLGRAAESLPATEPLRVPRGTALVVSGRASTELRDVALTAGARVVHLVPNGHAFAGRMMAESSGRWTWQALGAAGPLAEVPNAMELTVLADSLPQAEIMTPTADSTVDGLAPVSLALAASDDHGLANVALRVWRERADGTREAVSETRLAGAAPLWSGAATVDLAARKMAPGDKLHVQAVATDASPWHQAGLSRDLVLRVPSTSELRAQARAAADSAVARAQAAAQAQRELAQRTNDAARSREQSGRRDANSVQGSKAGAEGEKSMSFAAAERAKGLAQEQRKLADRVQALQDQAKALQRQLKQAGALDSALAGQLADVQRLLKDALTPELAQQLQSLEQNAGKLSGGQAQQSLEQLAAQQRALRQQLEKSVEMLKRAALEGSMQTLRDEARDLASAEKKEAERQSGDGAQQGQAQAPTPEQSRELADRSRALTKDVEQLTKRLRDEKADVGAQKSAEAARHADEAADAMERAARQQQQRDAGKQDASNESQRGERQQNSPQNSMMAGNDRQQSSGNKSGQQSGQRQQGGQQQQQGGQQGNQQQNGQQSGQQQGGQQGNQQNGQRQQGASPDGARAAQQAANEMQQAADQLGQARQQQIDAWKNELGGELDRAIQETMQMAREQSAVEQQARSGADGQSVRSAQGAVQQGVEQTAQRLDQAGKKSSLLSQRAQRALDDARQQVSEATRAAQQQGTPQGGQSGDASRMSNAMKDAGEALNRAAASLVRDRERVNGAQSASGFEDMIQQMKELAKQQGQINAQASGLPMPGQQGGEAGRDAARQLAKQQRGVAEKLDELGDGDPSGRSDALAKEARQLAQQLDRAGADPQTAQRQQQLYRRLLDAGRTLEQNERDESGKREAKSGAGVDGVAPASGATNGRDANKYQTPDWAQLRGLSADERRLVLEYFRRLNGTPPTP